MMYIRAGTKVAKQHLKFRQQKWMSIRRFTHVFINVDLTLIGYSLPPKPDYCVLVGVSTWFSIAALRNETEQPTTQPKLMFRLQKCARANIKVGVAGKLQREKFSFECAPNKRRFEHQTFTPVLIYIIILYIHKL